MYLSKLQLTSYFTQSLIPCWSVTIKAIWGGQFAVCAPVNALFTPLCWSPPTKGRRKEMLNARAKKYWMREQRNTECTRGGGSHTTRADLERVPSKSIGFGRLSKTNERLFSLGLITAPVSPMTVPIRICFRDIWEDKMHFEKCPSCNAFNTKWLLFWCWNHDFQKKKKSRVWTALTSQFGTLFFHQ